MNEAIEKNIVEQATAHSKEHGITLETLLNHPPSGLSLYMPFKPGVAGSNEIVIGNVGDEDNQ
jgi:hypothetical protein